MIIYSTKKKQRTGLLPAEADRNMASPTESAVWKSRRREHLGAGCLKEE